MSPSGSDESVPSSTTGSCSPVVMSEPAFATGGLFKLKKYASPELLTTPLGADGAPTTMPVPVATEEPNPPPPPWCRVSIK